MNKKKITPAKPRRERSYPQAVRVYSTQAGTHPEKSGIDCFVDYYSVRWLLDAYAKMFQHYKGNMPFKVDASVIHRPEPFYVLQGVNNFLPGKLWVPYADAMALMNKIDALVNRHNRRVDYRRAPRASNTVGQ